MDTYGCTQYGSLDDSKFSQPMPWIGLYSAVACVLCAISMSIDAFNGIRHHELWFPCKFSSLDATTLSLLNVSNKFLLDLNTSMPREEDQLTKLSSNVMTCTIIGNIIPSLGTMKNKELSMNVLGLVIFGVTVIVNTCIQLVTGVIYMYRKENIIVMFILLVLLAMMVSSALTVPANNRYFDTKFKKKYELAIRQSNSNPATTCKTKKLREDLIRFWMMAHTCSPQFVMGHLATCTASGTICVISALVLVEAKLRTIMMPSCFKFCDGESDYKWSSTLILVMQSITIGVGCITPIYRWFSVINFKYPQFEFNVENYWIEQLKIWKEYPLVLEIRCRLCRKLVHNMKDKGFSFCIWMQISIVLFSKLIRLGSIYFARWLLIIFKCCRKLKNKIATSIGFSVTDSLSMHHSDPDLKQYVLYLEGEDHLVDELVKKNFNVTNHWMKMGKKRSPKHLLRLLEEIEPSQKFEGVWKFDSVQVPPLDQRIVNPPNSWTLSVVTLTSITIAVLNNDICSIEELISSVTQGLSFIRIVETETDKEGCLSNIRKAADMVWLGVDLDYKWLEVDLRKIVHHGRTLKEVIEELASMAEKKVKKFLEDHTIEEDLKEHPSKWPIKVLSANSMYRVCKTLLLDLDSRDQKEIVLKRLLTMITDIICACLTNLRHVIYMQCETSTREEREENIRCAIILLGKVEKLVDKLDDHQLPSLEADQFAYIDEWRATNLCELLSEKVVEVEHKLNDLWKHISAHALTIQDLLNVHVKD